MRFGGLIAATAWIVAITGAAAQTPDAGAAQAQQPASQQQQQQQQGDQPPVHNPDADAQAAQEKTKQADPKAKKARTAEEEREEKIRQYDPLAPQTPDQSADGKGKSQSKSSASGEKSNDDQSAEGGAAGPAVDGDSDSATDSAAYSGPAVLSRSYTLMRPSIPSQERWNPIIGINGIYDSGLKGFQSTETNGFDTGGSFGAEILWGISGRHYFRHDIIGINYRGDIQYYSPAKYFDGSNQWLDLDYTHYFSRRLSLTLVEAGSVYSQNYTLVNPVTVSEEASTTNPAATPNTELFDNGLKTASSSADVTYQKSVRLSFNAGGTWFGVVRDASYLLGASGLSGRVDAMYRVNRRTTIGLAYSYNNFWYPKGTGRTIFHTMDAIYSWEVARSIQLHARVGASRLNTSGLATENVDPGLAALLGASSITEQYQTIQWVSDYSVQLSKDFHRGRGASISYNRGLSPGNGLYLTSRQTDIAASGSMILFRHYYFSTGVGYDSLSAAAQNLGEYRSTYAFFGFSHAIRHGIQGNLRFDYRHFDVGNAPLLTNTFRITLGFTWSPVEGLHRLW